MKKCIAMILAEGRSDKLGALTSYSSKPAVYFGGKKRIIDFTVSNCINSGIETIGILSQYHSAELHRHIDKSYSGKGLYMLPACLTGKTYNGMADAVYKNMGFIERYEPDYVLILQGDHIYKMNYKKMIEDHIKSGADATVAVRRILPSQSSTFGCVEMGTNGLVADIRKMPQQMDLERIMTGVYVFNWGTLRKNLILDAYYEESLHDFYGDILPFMLLTRQTINTYESNGYWREVSTIESMWEANMEVLDLKSIRTRLLASDQYISGEID
ncbi:MAG: glucose-1-phosphate adenylyltransferase, partial [Peptococcaceae bacterium]|nr:glucose-1-phosphate adenylyltransferase [Peptococcaceae bacterium]